MFSRRFQQLEDLFDRLLVLTDPIIQIVAMTCGLAVLGAIRTHYWWLMQPKAKNPIENYSDPFSLYFITGALLFVTYAVIWLYPWDCPKLKRHFQTTIITSGVHRILLIWLFASGGAYRDLREVCLISVIGFTGGLIGQVDDLRRLRLSHPEGRMHLDWMQPILGGQNLLFYWYALRFNQMTMLCLFYPLLYIQTYGTRLIYEWLVAMLENEGKPVNWRLVIHQTLQGYAEDLKWRWRRQDPAR